MTEEQITKDRQRRVSEAKKDIEAVLSKHELTLTAEDMIGEHTKISVMLQFQDIKKYPDADLAQPEGVPIDMKDFEDSLSGEGDKI